MKNSFKIILASAGLFASAQMYGAVKSITTFEPLPSLSQDMFKGADNDCGYFMLYNMLVLNNPQTTMAEGSKELLNKARFEKLYTSWKAGLKSQTKLSPEEITTLISKVTALKKQAEHIAIISDPSFFQFLFQSNPKDAHTVLYNHAQTWDQPTLAAALQECKLPFAIGLNITNIDETIHWITFVVRNENGSIKVYQTNSITPKMIEDNIKAFGLTTAESKQIHRKMEAESAFIKQIGLCLQQAFETSFKKSQKNDVFMSF